MIEAKVSTFKSLRREGIQELVQSPGPCISLLLPPYRPGEQAMSTAALLKANLRNAAWQLVERKLREPAISDLLSHYKNWVEDRALPGGCHWGRAFFVRSTCFGSSNSHSQ